MSIPKKVNELIAAYDKYYSLLEEEELYISRGHKPPEDFIEKINKSYVKYKTLLYELPYFDLDLYLDLR